MGKVVKNYLYTFGYQVFLMILPVFTLPYISRVLLPKGVGINSWTYSISYYFVLLAVLGLTTYGQREIALWRSSERRFKTTFWEIEIASVITTVISLVLYAITILALNRYPKYLLIYGISVLASLFDISWLFSGLEKFAILSIRNFIIKTLSIVLMFVFVKIPNDLGIYIFIQCVTILLSNLSLWPSALKLVGRIKVRSMFYVFLRIKHSFSYFIPQVSISLYVTLNKVLLGFFAGTVQTGYFDSSDKIVRLIFTAFTAISTVMLPRISSMFSQKKYEQIRVVMDRVLFISSFLIIPMSFLLATNAQLIVQVVLGPKYVLMVNVLQLSALIILPMSIANVLGNQVLVPFNRIRTYTWSVVGGAVVNLLVDVPLILILKAQGAAVASLISETIVMLLQSWFCRDILDIKQVVHSCWTQGLLGLCLLLPAGIALVSVPGMNPFWKMILSLVTVIIYVVVLAPKVFTQIRALLS